MRKSVLKIALGVFTVIVWSLFLFLDVQWNECLQRAVREGNRTYGELYGPLIFFRPTAMYLSLGLSLTCGAWLACETIRRR